MAQQSLGLIETIGLTAAVEAADAAVKAANVALVGYEHAKGNGMILVKVVGEVGSVNAAVAAAKSAAGMINQVVSTRVIARPADGIEGLIYNSETRGFEKEPDPVRAESKGNEPEVQEQDKVQPENTSKETATTPVRRQKTARKTTTAATKS